MRSIAILLALFVATVATAQSNHAELSAALNFTSLHAGQQAAAAAVVLDIKPGFHAQSNTPSKPNYIKLEVTLDDNPAVTFYEPIYPPGEEKSYPVLGELNVYTGQVIVHVPFQVNPDAAPGPLTISGKMRYQICDERTCFMPVNAPFTLETQIVPPGQPVEPKSDDFFKTFDAAIFSRLSPSPAASANEPAPTEISFFGYRISLADNAVFLAMGIAFIVGILFNVMPCVLPVVPIKALGFYEVSQHNRAKSFFLGCMFSLGILLSFAALAMIVVVFRSLTWGEQFSYPWFTWTIVAILVVMAFGMFGTFNFFLPAGIYRFTPRHDTISGNLLFGIFATVLSTPCTAPMFGGLLAWAIQQPAALGVTVVMMVGLGMAFPYLLLSAFPELARRFPRTGPWAELVKQMMGFVLLAVAAYFAGGRLVSGQGFFWAVYAILVAGLIFLVVRTIQLTPRPIPIVITTLLALLMGVAGLIATMQMTREVIAWEPYSPESLLAARDGNQITIVEFTANWCANCHVLEATVLKNPQVVQAFQDFGVVPLQADLSDTDAPGQSLLKDLNPAGGIPLTAVYPPGQSEPILLSSIYSVQNLLDALHEARGQGSAARGQ